MIVTFILMFLNCQWSYKVQQNNPNSLVMLHSEDVEIENIIKSPNNVVQAWMEFDLYWLHRRRNGGQGRH